MKTYLIITALSLLILAGCSTTKTTADYDDVYSGSNSIKEEPTNNMAGNTTVSPDFSEQNNPADYYVEDFETGENAGFKDEPYLTTNETVTSPEGTSNITNNYYDGYGYDDYYDYSYASRINRFYSPYMGYNYYSPCYTGFYYDPWYYDSWYGPYFSFGYNWGYGSMYWGYPYYSYYYPYNSYWYGYNNGFWDGYYYGNYGNDYYGSNNYYYGHRPTRSGSNGPNSNVSRTEQQNNLATLHPNYFERTKPELSGDFSKGSRSSEKDVEIPGRISSNSINNNPGGAISEEKKIPQNDISNSRQNEQGSNQRYTYKKPEPSTQSKTDYKPGETIKINNQRPTQKYSKPSGRSSSDNTGRSQQGSTTGSKNTQTYSRPQSTQNDSYSRPAKYNTDNSRNNQPSRQSSDSYSKPAPSENKSYSQPSRSSGTYNQPSRSNSSKSYSSPSNSGSSKSYSSPSRSSNSGSSSSPSRSSSGSGGSSRGGRK